jgi:hypothetical protein
MLLASLAAQAVGEGLGSLLQLPPFWGAIARAVSSAQEAQAAEIAEPLVAALEEAARGEGHATGRWQLSCALTITLDALPVGTPHAAALGRVAERALAAASALLEGTPEIDSEVPLEVEVAPTGGTGLQSAASVLVWRAATALARACDELQHPAVWGRPLPSKPCAALRAAHSALRRPCSAAGAELRLAAVDAVAYESSLGSVRDGGRFVTFEQRAPSCKGRRASSFKGRPASSSQVELALVEAPGLQLDEGWVAQMRPAESLRKKLRKKVGSLVRWAADEACSAAGGVVAASVAACASAGSAAASHWQRL